MRRKIIVFVDDKDGYKIKMKWLWKKLWVVLSEEEQEELNKVWDKMYRNYCNMLKRKKCDMKEYDMPSRAICNICINYGEPCPYRDGVTCPRYRRNIRLAGIIISVAAIVIVIAISILCNYADKMS